VSEAPQDVWVLSDKNRTWSNASLALLRSIAAQGDASA